MLRRCPACSARRCPRRSRTPWRGFGVSAASAAALRAVDGDGWAVAAFFRRLWPRPRSPSATSPATTALCAADFRSWRAATYCPFCRYLPDDVGRARQRGLSEEPGLGAGGGGGDQLVERDPVVLLPGDVLPGVEVLPVRRHGPRVEGPLRFGGDDRVTFVPPAGLDLVDLQPEIVALARVVRGGQEPLDVGVAARQRLLAGGFLAGDGAVDLLSCRVWRSSSAAALRDAGPWRTRRASRRRR